MLSSKLHMTEGEAEKWLVELMRTAALDARIDATERQVIMAVPTSSVYQQVVERTRDITMRTRALVDGIEAPAGEGAAAAGGAAEGGAGRPGGGYRGGAPGGGAAAAAAAGGGGGGGAAGGRPRPGGRA